VPSLAQADFQQAHVPFALMSKVVIVVSASQGIGTATMRLSALAGARVILGGINEERGRAFPAELAALGHSAGWRLAGLNDEASLKSLMNGTAADHGRIGGRFNNGADLALSIATRRPPIPRSSRVCYAQTGRST
jgi:NAD(P)-dependent dehydrogenase (short-subunit alcohol dehydrogenase family)